MKKDKKQPKTKKEENAKRTRIAEGLSVSMCIGTGVGTAIGAAMGNMGLYMCLGLSVGMCLGVAVGSAIKKDDEDE